MDANKSLANTHLLWLPRSGLEDEALAEGRGIYVQAHCHFVLARVDDGVDPAPIVHVAHVALGLGRAPGAARLGQAPVLGAALVPHLLERALE